MPCSREGKSVGMPRSRKALETPQLGEKVVELEVIPAYALKGDIPGYTFTGLTPEQALINAKAFVIPFYKARGYWPVSVTVKDSDDDSS